jgi:hypothetical protein
MHFKTTKRDPRWQIAEESRNPELEDFRKHFRVVIATFEEF